MLADLDSLERRREPLAKKAQVGDKEAKAQLVLIDKALELVRAGKPARFAQPRRGGGAALAPLQLLTAKPVLYVCNVDEASIAGNALTRKVAERARAEGAGCVVISAKIEAELAGLEPEERADYLQHLGLKEPGLNALIREGYRVLDLITFFTAGPKEARAWTVTAGTKAPKAAGAIHTDFEKGFIRAETIAYDDYVGARRRDRRQGGRQDAPGRQGVRRQGRRRHALPLRELRRCACARRRCRQLPQISAGASDVTASRPRQLPRSACSIGRRHWQHARANRFCGSRCCSAPSSCGLAPGRRVQADRPPDATR